MNAQETELKYPSYEAFILLLSLLSLANLVYLLLFAPPDVAEIVRTVDLALSLVFLLDFAYRFLTAENRGHYFVRGFGWLDLVGSLPAPFLRIGRLYRVAWVLPRLNPGRRRGVIRQMLHDRAESALLGVLFLTIVLLEVASALMLSVEQTAPNSNIRNASDALWWTWVSVTTVGYGDRFPVTNLGRWIGVVTLALGVGLFGTLTGYLANAFLRPSARFEREAAAREERFRVELARIQQVLYAVERHVDSDPVEASPSPADTPSETTQRAGPVPR
jgi:voltage-gated potassium channel